MHSSLGNVMEKVLAAYRKSSKQWCSTLNKLADGVLLLAYSLLKLLWHDKHKVPCNLTTSRIKQMEKQFPGAITFAAPCKQWYLQHYDKDLGRKKKAVAGATKKEGEEAEGAPEEAKKSNHVVRKIEKRQEECKLDPHVEEQFSGGRLLAAISSRPGQCGRADGYILEGKELEFYMKKLQKKKGKGAA